MDTKISTLKNSLFSLLLNSSNPSQIISLSYGLFRFWVEDYFEEETCNIYPILRTDGLEHLNPQGQIRALKQAIAKIS